MEVAKDKTRVEITYLTSEKKGTSAEMIWFDKGEDTCEMSSRTGREEWKRVRE
jgi:hypothetical protein